MDDIERTSLKGSAIAGPAAGKIARWLLGKIILWLLSILGPLIVPVLLAAVLYLFLYGAVFLLPAYITQDYHSNEAGTENMVAIFNTGRKDEWKLKDDQELLEEYKYLDDKWLAMFESQEQFENQAVEYCEGNDALKGVKVKDVWGKYFPGDGGLPSERTQVWSYRLSWALLAAVDRILGDPAVSGLKKRKPDPDGHFGSLCPYGLKWDTFQLYYHCNWVAGEGEKEVTYSKTYKHDMSLLSEISTYSAGKIVFEWEARQYRRNDDGCRFEEAAVYPVLVSAVTKGPYYGRLRDLLKANGLLKESNLELVLNLAMSYDQDFAYDESMVSGSIAELLYPSEGPAYSGAGNPGLTWPAGKYRVVTSGYGWRMHPVLMSYKFHKGIDIAVPRGESIFAAADGRVVLAGWVKGYGKTIIIDHGSFRTLYAHLMTCQVMPGCIVARGEEIGKADSTGLSTGNHLHFEIRAGEGENVFKDPEERLDHPYLQEVPY